MPESVRVAAVREAYEAFNKGDTDAVLGLLDERVESHRVAPLQPLRLNEQLAEPQEIIEDGDRILVVARACARGRESGVELDQMVFHLLQIEGDRAVRFEVHIDRDEAFAALRR